MKAIVNEAAKGVNINNIENNNISNEISAISAMWAAKYQLRQHTASAAGAKDNGVISQATALGINGGVAENNRRNQRQNQRNGVVKNGGMGISSAAASKAK